MGYVSRWGGMDVGRGMLLSAETVDGLVHQLGGTRLRVECSLVPPHRRRRCRDGHGGPGDAPPSPSSSSSVDGEICPVGYAVATSPGGDGLRRHYDAIIHTTPPFYDHPPPPHPITIPIATAAMGEPTNGDAHARSRALLGSCYRRSFDLAFGNDDALSSSSKRFGHGGWMRDSLRRLLVWLGRSGNPPNAGGRPGGRRVAVPLLGSGCRAFPRDVASDVAASEAASWLLSVRGDDYDLDDPDVETYSSNVDDAGYGNEDSVVVFGLLSRDDAEVLSAKLRRLLSD